MISKRTSEVVKEEKEVLLDLGLRKRAIRASVPVVRGNTIYVRLTRGKTIKLTDMYEN